MTFLDWWDKDKDSFRRALRALMRDPFDAGVESQQAKIKRLRELIRRLRSQLLSEHFRGLNPSPVEVDHEFREWDAETERLLSAAEAKEK